MPTEILAACHVHSKWSYDGSWTLEALSEEFSRRGCRVLMMTEHDRGFTVERLDEYRDACARASSERILVVPGIEYSDAANQVHVLVWGRLPFLGEGLPTGQMLAQVRAMGGVAVLAHPSRRDAWKNYDPSWSSSLLGIEVWNRKYDGWAPSRTAPPLLSAASAIPFAGLDFHTHRQFFPLTMALEMGEVIDEEAVVNCLRSRQCYARAFGRRLDADPIHRALPVLGVVERGRRAVRSVVRLSKNAARRSAKKENLGAS